MNHVLRHLLQIAPVLVAALIPGIGQAASWDITPSIATTLTFGDNISSQPKGHEEEEIWLGVKPAVRVQGGADQTQLRLSYGLDSLYHKNVPGRNSSHHSLLSNGNAELFPDLIFINATGLITYQPITPKAAINLGTFAFSDESTRVDTWSVSPYLQKIISGGVLLQTGTNLNVVEYEGFLPNSFAREYFFSASSGASSQYVLWKLDLKKNDIYNDSPLKNSSRASAELDLKYKMLPAWALTGRVGYVDYQYDPELSKEPKGIIWRAGAAWLPSARTVLELGVSKNFFERAKYGVFTYQGRWLHWNVYYDAAVTTRRELQTEYAKVQTIDPLTQLPTTLDVRFLTEREEVFINKVARLTSGYKSDELSVELFGYRDRRQFQATGGREVVVGGGVTVELFLSQRASLKSSISQAKINSTQPEITLTRLSDLSLSLQRKFGKGLIASINLNRSVRESTDPLFTESEANLISTSMQMEF